MHWWYHHDIVTDTEARCIDGDVRLGFQTSLPDDGFGPGIGGYVEVCVDGEYATVCANEDYSSVDIDELGTLACYDLGYEPEESMFHLYNIG